MKLFEIVTTGCGESYVRCYCCLESEEKAREMFAAAYPGETIAQVIFLACSGVPFMTQLSDSGFEPERMILPLREAQS